MIETLRDFVVKTNELGIEYMVTGSFAMSAYAGNQVYPRYRCRPADLRKTKLEDLPNFSSPIIT